MGVVTGLESVNPKLSSVSSIGKADCTVISAVHSLSLSLSVFFIHFRFGFTGHPFRRRSLSFSFYLI